MRRKRYLYLVFFIEKMIVFSFMSYFLFCFLERFNNKKEGEREINTIFIFHFLPNCFLFLLFKDH